MSAKSRTKAFTHVSERGLYSAARTAVLGAEHEKTRGAAQDLARLEAKLKR